MPGSASRARFAEGGDGRAAAPLPAAAGRGDVLLDTGVLVALHLRDDPRHAEAVAWFGAFHGALHTVEAVLAEASYFIPAAARAGLAELAASGRLKLHGADRPACVRIAELFRKYADQDPDWADLALVQLAESTGITRIATLDIADFSVYRIHGRKRFELELLR